MVKNIKNLIIILILSLTLLVSGSFLFNTDIKNVNAFNEIENVSQEKLNSTDIVYLHQKWRNAISSAIDIKSITSVEFTYTQPQSGEYTVSYNVGATSETQTNLNYSDSVIAYINGTEVIIHSNSDIYTPQDSSSLFGYGTYSTQLSAVTTLTLTNFHTSTATNMHNMFSNCISLKSLDANSWDTSNVQDMSAMFGVCSALKTLKISSWDTGKVETFQNMFWGCSALNELDLNSWNTENVTEMYGVFQGCEALRRLYISNWNTSKVESMAYMFVGCASLSNFDLKKWDVSNVNRTDNMFASCSSISSIDLSNWQTDNLQTIYAMFKDCINLTNVNISGWNYSNIKSASYLFAYCAALTTIDLSYLDTSSFEDVSFMFYSCSLLENVNLQNWNTQNLKKATSMFWGCESLKYIDLSSFDLTNVTDCGNVFTMLSCSNLSRIKVPKVNPIPDMPMGVGGSVSWYLSTDYSVYYNVMPITTGTSALYIRGNLIHFDGNGNTGGTAPASILKEYNVPVTLPTNTFTKTGYKFLGWVYYTSNSNYMQEGSQYTTNDYLERILYAKWESEDISYTIKYNGNNATGGTTLNSSHKYNKVSIITANGFEKKYTVTYNYQGATGNNSKTSDTATYNFKGWYSNTTGGSYGLTSSCDSTVSSTETLIPNNAYVLNLTSINASIITFTAQWDSANITLPNPNRTGYEFAGWYTQTTGGQLVGQGAESYTPTSTITIYARWTAIKYSITYNLDGGSVSPSNPTQYTIEDQITLINPTKEHHTFIGWTGSNGITAQTSVTIAQGTTGDKAYTANWELTEYKITLDNTLATMSGSLSATTYTVSENPTTVTITLPIRKGYNVSSFEISGDNNQATLSSNLLSLTIPANSYGDIVLTPVWEVITYTISYNINNGFVPGSNPKTYTVETETFTLINARRDGYVFTGWTGTGLNSLTKTVTIVKGTTGNLEFKANFTPNVYTISYDLAGGTLATENPTEYNYETPTFTLNNPIKQGYVFAGWTGTSLSEPTIQVTIQRRSTGNLEFTATWIEDPDNQYIVNHYIMNISGNYGSAISQHKTGTTGATLTLADLKDENYEVENGIAYAHGKVAGEEVETATILADGSLVIDLYYERSEYTVTLIAGNGIESVTGAETYYYDQEVSISATVKAGYEWKDWTGYATVTDKDHTFKMPTQDVEFTANTTLVTYTILYTLNGGVVETSNPETYTVESETFTLVNPTKVGYTFTGWTGSGLDSARMEVTIAKGTTGNLEFIATWETNGNTKYVVNHHIMNTNGEYASPIAEELKGTTASTLTLADLKDENYEVENGISYAYGKVAGTEVETATILADGSLVIDLYYERSSYAVTLITGNGIESVTGAEKYYYDQEVSISATVKAGYEWKDWTGYATVTDKDHTFKMPTQDVEFTANTTIITYTISYELNDGVVETENVSEYTVETETFTINNPTKENYIFTGWTGTGLDTETQTVTIYKGTTGNLHYIANWKAKDGIKYIVNHHIMNTSGEYILENIQEKTGISGAKLILASQKNTAYEVENGISYAYGKVAETKIEETTIFADGSLVIDLYYERSSYTLTLIAGNGIESVTGAQTYYYDQEVSISATVKAGYEWKGWTGYETVTEQNYTFKMPTQNVEFTANTTIITYTISYELNDGVVAIENVTEYTVESATFTLNNPTKEGYTFTGWTGSGLDSERMEVTIEKGTTGNLEFTATWLVITYNITYDLNQGTQEISNPYSYTIETPTFTLNNPSRIGYTFTGWTVPDSAILQLMVIIPKGTIGDLHFTANWTVNILTGDVTITGEAVYGSEITATFTEIMQQLHEDNQLIYQWQIGDGENSNFVNIQGATNATFKIVGDIYAGKFIRLHAISNSVVYAGAMNSDAILIKAKQLDYATYAIASDKIYDANRNANISQHATLSGVESGDEVLLNLINANFVSAQVANNAEVVVNYELLGEDRENYTLKIHPIIYANIILPLNTVTIAFNSDSIDSTEKINLNILAITSTGRRFIATIKSNQNITLCQLDEFGTCDIFFTVNMNCNIIGESKVTVDLTQQHQQIVCQIEKETVNAQTLSLVVRNNNKVVARTNLAQTIATTPKHNNITEIILILAVLILNIINAVKRRRLYA